MGLCVATVAEVPRQSPCALVCPRSHGLLSVPVAKSLARTELHQRKVGAPPSRWIGWARLVAVAVVGCSEVWSCVRAAAAICVARTEHRRARGSLRSREAARRSLDPPELHAFSVPLKRLCGGSCAARHDAARRCVAVGRACGRHVRARSASRGRSRRLSRPRKVYRRFSPGSRRWGRGFGV